jgi:hypothetical protein
VSAAELASRHVTMTNRNIRSNRIDALAVHCARSSRNAKNITKHDLTQSFLADSRHFIRS